MSTVEVLEWLFSRGTREKNEENYEKARERFRKILNITREASWVEKASVALAEVFIEEENYFWAMNHIRKALDKNPNCTHYHYLKGKIHYERKEFEKAASEALKAVEDNLTEHRYYQLLGKSTYKCDGYDTAYRFLDWAVKCAPDKASPRLDLARLEIQEGKFQSALEILKEALEETGENEKIRDKMRAIQENWKITGS
ncbi:MAG: tetratricopeptide repeat protein [bacterium]